MGHLRTCISFELTGECLSSSARRQWYNVSAVGFTIEANLRLTSDASWCLSIQLMLRKDDLMEGGPGILRSRLQSSTKWSNVSSFEAELDTRILSSGRYMIQSNICPCVWVGRFTDCAKLKIFYRSRILDICWSVGRLKWKLKSPKINRQPVMELQYSRNADSCSTNRESVRLFFRLGGGL